MIGKITTGSNFKSLFNYLLKKGKEARILGGDRVLLEPNVNQLANQFNWIARTRPTTKKPVKHLSISFAPEDGQVSSETKVAISEKVVNELGYDNNQWVVIAHQRDDPDHDWQHEHDHIHIVVNGINIDGERVKDSFDKTRLEKILRGLEEEHGLRRVFSSNQCNRHRPSTNQLRRYQRETKEYNHKKQDAPPEIPVMAKLETAIDLASSDKPTMTVFIGRLQDLGIDVRATITDKGRKRISYGLEDLKVRGSKIHNGSFPKLISQRGIDFNETRDTPALEAAFQGEKVTVKKEEVLTQISGGQHSGETPELRPQKEEVDLTLLPSAFCPLPSRAKPDNLDLNYWLPEKLKIITQKNLTEEAADPKQWETLQQKLLDNYGISREASSWFKKIDLISANKQGDPIWHKNNLLGGKNNYFSLGANHNGNPIRKIVVAKSPVEALSAYLVNEFVKEDHSPCLYVSLDIPEQLNELDLTRFDSIVVSSNDKQLVPDNIPKLVVEYDVNSWQQSWLICWIKSQQMMKSEAKESRTKNLFFNKTSKQDHQLEL